MTLPVATTWFSVEPLGDGVTLLTEPYVDPLLRANLFHVRGRDADLLVDAGTGIAPLRPALGGLLDPGRPVIAVATHAHYDHVGGMHEFAERLVHPAEAGQLAGDDVFASLLAEDFPQEWRDQAAAEGYPLPDVLVTAVPWEGYDPASYTLVPAPSSATIDEGDELSLGNRAFTVLHTPGHSPGGISLLERATGILFSGDAVYDDALLDELPGSDIPDYLLTMRRLRDLEGVTIVHAGHGASFGPERMRELCDAYLTLRG